MRWLLWVLVGCGSSVESLSVPDDPGAVGVPVGVRTITDGRQVYEVWYPAADVHADDPGDEIQLRDLLPPEMVERIPEIVVPPIVTRAVRDAEPRLTEERWPVVLFSHGFGAFRTQSPDLTTHLASRGFVVVAPDHPGRMLVELAPCLLVPPAGDCEFPAGDDPAPEDLVDALAWISGTTILGDQVDPSILGVFGHSAGAFTTTTFAEDTRVDAALALAGGGRFVRDLPTATVGGSCDGVVLESELLDGQHTSDGYVSLAGVGHLAFSDICGVGLGEAAEALALREDANTVLIDQLFALATDGCPGFSPTVEGCDSFMPAADASPMIRHYVGAFFDHYLLGRGPGVTEGVFDEAVFR